MIPERYTAALDDIFTYRMGNGPAGVPRFFIVRTWVGVETPVVWLMNTMRLAEAQECCEIVRNIMVGMIDDRADDTISIEEADDILWRLRDRICLLENVEAENILDDLGIPMRYIKSIHKSIEHIDVVPFTVETGFRPDLVSSVVDRIPVTNED